MRAGQTVAKATVVIMFFTLLSRVLGLVRDAAIAYRFGATATTDAFLVAFVIPFIFLSIIGMALNTVVVPIFTEYSTQGRREEAWRVMSLLMNAVLVVTVALSVLGMVEAPAIARLLGAGFPPATMHVAIRLMALMMPSIVFLNIAGMLGSILNANNIFGPPAFGPAAMNIAIIVAALGGAPSIGVDALVYGVVVGTIIYVLVQLPALRRAGFRYYFNFNFRDPVLRRVGGIALPVLISSIITQVYIVVDRFLASGLPEGSIAALNYANNLMNIPQGIFVLAVTTAVFPSLSRQAAEKQWPEMAATLRRSLRVVLLLAAPVAVGLIVLREPLIVLMFQRGAFDARATVMTAQALLFFAIGLAGFCLIPPLMRGFFALQDTRTPLNVSLITVALKILFSVILVRYMQQAGLALGSTLMAFAHMTLLFWLLQRRLPGLFDGMLLRFGVVTILAAAVMGVTVNALDGCLAVNIAGGIAWLMIRVGIDAICGAMVFTAAGLVLRIEEMQRIVGTVRGFVRRRLYVARRT